MSDILKPKYAQTRPTQSTNKKQQQPIPASSLRGMLQMVEGTLKLQSRLDQQLSMIKKMFLTDRRKETADANKTNKQIMTLINLTNQTENQNSDPIGNPPDKATLTRHKEGRQLYEIHENKLTFPVIVRKPKIVQETQKAEREFKSKFKQYERMILQQLKEEDRRNKSIEPMREPEPLCHNFTRTIRKRTVSIPYNRQKNKKDQNDPQYEDSHLWTNRQKDEKYGKKEMTLKEILGEFKTIELSPVRII